MKMDKVAGSGNDNFYTPPYAVKPILAYAPPQLTVWCPFDTEESHFVKMLRAQGNKVISSVWKLIKIILKSPKSVLTKRLK